MPSFKDMDEDAITEALETAESDLDYATVVGVMEFSLSDDCEDGLTIGEAACDVMFRISSTPVGKVALGEAGACEKVVALTKKYMEEVSVVEVTLGIVQRLSADCSTNQDRFAMGELATANLIVESMNTHTDGEATLQEQACLAAAALATNCPANAELLVDAGIRDALTAAEGYITNERNKSYPSRAMSAIFPDA